tara:strand:- start:71 stop:268 length:198 start_codon:yes stop_codon:yes gene_type:complete
MSKSISEQINFERKDKKKKPDTKVKPKPFPKDAPKRLHAIYKKKYEQSPGFLDMLTSELKKKFKK